MTAVAGSIFNVQEERIEEVINKSIDFILPGLDPIWEGAIATSQGVGAADALGRDMHILRVFLSGMTGVLEQAKPRGDFPLYGDTTSDTTNEPYGTRLFLQDQTQTFPDPLEGPNQKPYRLGIPMRAMVANIAMSLGELTSEAQDAFIGQILAPKMVGFARNISHTLSTYFYLSQNNDYQLATIGSIAGVSDAAVSGAFFFTFKPTNEAVDRFFVGQRVDIYDATGTDRKNDSQSAAANQTTSTRIKLFVDYVDELTGTVRLVTNSDPNSWSGHGGEDPLNGDIVVYANSRDNAASPNFTGIAGINSWLKTGGESDTNLLGAEKISADAIDVAVYPEHKSFSQHFGGEALTEHTLRKILRRWHAAKRKYGQTIDTVIASDGVWLAYEAVRIGREMLDRTGRVASLSSQGLNSDTNFGGFMFTMDGRNYKGMTSTYVDDGVMYGIKTGGSNWKRYVPRDTQGTTEFDRNEVPFIPFRFVASALTGLSTNRLPIRDASGSGNRTLTTELSEMPGWLRMQLVPDQFAGMRLTGLATDKVFSDETANGF